MLKKHSQLFEGLFAASDLLVVSLCWALSYWIRFASGWLEVEKGIPAFTDYLRVLIFVWLIWAFVFRRFNLYKPMRGANRLREVFLVIRANSFCTVLFVAMTFLFWEKTVPFSRLVFLIFWALSTVFLIASRSSLRFMLRSMRRRGMNLRYALIVGAGTLANKVASRMLAHPEFGTELIGCLAAEGPTRLESVGSTNGRYTNGFAKSAPQQSSGMTVAVRGSVLEIAEVQQETVSQMRVIGSYSDLPRLLEQGGIDQVIVALPLNDHNKLEGVISSIGDHMVDVRIVPDFHQFVQLGSLIEEFEGLPVLSLASTPLDGFNRVLKRILDLCFGTIFLVIATPVMLLTAALLKLSSWRSPIFYKQERVGLDGRSFNIYKFCTMRPDAEAQGAKFAVKGDPRVTPLGKILRRFSIDELPQLVNVIMGHMSLVGPRPERPVFIQEFRRHVPKYMLRHKVQAGMTGWAQVNGWRGNTSIARRIEHDLYYIEHWSLSLDLKILGMTVIHGFRDRNAY